MELSICAVQIIKDVSIVIFILLITSGFKINSKRLKTRQVQVFSTLVIVFFLVNSIYVALKEKGDELKGYKQVISFILSGIMVATLYVAHEEYGKALKKLITYKESFKVKVMMRTRRVILFTVYSIILFACIIV